MKPNMQDRSSDTSAVRKIAKELGLPSRPAMFPVDIQSFAIELLTNED